MKTENAAKSEVDKLIDEKTSKWTIDEASGLVYKLRHHGFHREDGNLVPTFINDVTIRIDVSYDEYAYATDKKKREFAIAAKIAKLLNEENQNA